MSDVIAVVENTPKTEVIKGTGFAKRSVLDERIAKEEKELEELKKAQTTPVVEETLEEEEEEPTSAEEKSFKKRYGDLRRHTQKLQTDMQKQIEDLKAQLEQSTKGQIKLPKTEAELDAWTKEYPDVAKIVETIAIKKAQEQSAGLEDRLKKINEMQAQTLKEKAEAELMRLHPDFDKIRELDEFHEWVEQQPKWVQQALYDNETDAVSAARAIDLYKADKGLNTKKAKKSEDREAAESVRTNRTSAPDESGEAGAIRESEVERMSAKEYEARQNEIHAAIKSGKFVYDLSGAAR
jgi:DNA repair exonuclease SbcCD ATPase subunit